MPASRFRDDINIIGAPLTEICNRTYDDMRQRQLFKNIIYLGVLSALLDMDVPAIEELIGEQFRGKDALIKPNLHALQLGRDWATQALDCPLGLRLEKRDKVGDRIFVSGNDAAALGAVYGGATVCAWYPITPVLLARRGVRRALLTGCAATPRPRSSRYAIIQAEDELASIGMVIGAAWNGARAFTATSGPGISLMQEFIGLAYFAEIPAVIFDIQRGSPSTGMPTRTQQADILSAAYASHGDTKHVLLFPQDPNECFTFAADALDLADRLQTPVFVMIDLDIGMNDWLVPPLKWDPTRQYDRGKVMTLRGTRSRQGIRPLSRRRRRRHPVPHLSRHASDARRLFHPRHDQGPLRPLHRGRAGLRRQHAAAAAQVRDRQAPRAAPDQARGAARPTKYGAIYFGSTALAMEEALEALEERGIHLDTLRVRAFPFHDDVFDFIGNHERVFVVEQNRDKQMRTLLTTELEIDPARLVPILHYDGTPITARFIVKAIADLLSVVTLAPLRKALP